MPIIFNRNDSLRNPRGSYFNRHFISRKNQNVSRVSIQVNQPSNWKIFHEKDTKNNSNESRVSWLLRNISQEAPGRLESEGNSRRRSTSNPENEDSFCMLDKNLRTDKHADLPQLVNRAHAGFKVGMDPHLVEDCSGGTYFLRDTKKLVCVVFKPADEEFGAPNNPRQVPEMMGKHKSAYKGGIVPGFGMFRELAAYIIDRGIDEVPSDHGCAGVPPTHIAKVRHEKFITTKGDDIVRSPSYKVGSIQSFVRSVCTAEDMGSVLFDVGDIHRIAVLDIRMCNLDRHPGNILVCHDHPYKKYHATSGTQSNRSDNNIRFSSEPPSPLARSAPPDFNIFVHLEPPVIPVTNRPYRLVPIDHGYCIPHILHMKEVTFAWCEWNESNLPISEDLKSFIINLDVNKEEEILRRVARAALPEECLLTLRVCTSLLQYGVTNGLSLRDIGELFISFNDDDSPLQLAVYKAIREAIQEIKSSSCTISRLSNMTSHQSYMDISSDILCATAPVSKKKRNENLESELSFYINQGDDVLDIIRKQLDDCVKNLVKK